MLCLTFNKGKAEYVLSVSVIEKTFEFVREQDGLDVSETMHPYFQLSNGDFVSKDKVCKAIELLERFVQGNNPMYLTDAELFSNGNMVDAAMRFREKYDCGLIEAKQAIEHLRGETLI